MQALSSSEMDDRHPVAAFLDDFSIEITAKHLDKIASVASRVRSGTHTYIAMIDPADIGGMIAAAAELRNCGL